MPLRFPRREPSAALTREFGPRLPVALIVDTSEALRMSPPGALHAELRELWRTLGEDPMAAERIELAVLTAGGHPRLLDPRDSGRALREDDAAAGFASVERSSPPRLGAGGVCASAEAVGLAIALLNSRRARHQQLSLDVFGLWAVLVAATPPASNWGAVSELVRTAEADRIRVFRVVAAPGADLADLAGYLPDRPVLRMAELGVQLITAARGHVQFP